MILDTIQFIIAWGIIVFIIGYFFYKTYQAIRNEPLSKKLESSPWKRVDAKVIASQITDTFSYGRQALDINLEYVVNGNTYTGTGQIILNRGENPPTTVELVYKQTSPEAWEWLEDHSELTETGSSTRFVVFFIWATLILIGVGVVIAVYFPHIL